MQRWCGADDCHGSRVHAIRTGTQCCNATTVILCNGGKCSCLDGAPVQATGCHRCCNLRMVAQWVDGRGGGRRKGSKGKESKEETERKRRKPHTNPPNHTTSPMCNCAECITTFNAIRTSSPTMQYGPVRQQCNTDQFANNAIRTSSPTAILRR